jgi:hypothetical protein
MKANTVKLENGEATAVDTVKATYDQGLALIVVHAEDGVAEMARLTMKYRPKVKIVCASSD